MRKSRDWRDKEDFYPSDKPCVVCGDTYNTGSEPRFSYVVCEKHSDITPGQVSEIVRNREHQELSSSMGQE